MIWRMVMWLRKLRGTIAGMFFFYFIFIGVPTFPTVAGMKTRLRKPRMLMTRTRIKAGMMKKILKTVKSCLI